MSSPFPRSLVIREWLWKKTQIEKNIYIYMDWLNWLMSQYRKTNMAKFFFKAHSPVVEMNLFWKKDCIAVVEICWNFRNSFSARACTCEVFFATRKSNCTWTESDWFWRLFHLWRAFHESPHIRQICTSDCARAHNKQPLNWIRLIQAGKIHRCFVDLKRYFSLSKLIQSLFNCFFS